MWKFNTFLEFAFYVLLLLALPPVVNSNETPTPRMCAVCPEPRCATLVSGIWLEGNDEHILWKKQDEEIPQCFNDNLKSDKPCQVPNGNLVLRTMDELEFEWKNLTSRDTVLISSVNMPCADLNLPFKPSPGMCAVCLEKDCAIGVRTIYPAGSDIAIWLKANSPTGIQNCSMENLKADAPCKMADGSLVQLANEMLHFDGIDTYGVRRPFKSQISPCADLNLPFKPSLVIHTSTPAAADISVADNKGIIIGSVIGIIIFIISIGVLIWIFCNCGKRDSCKWKSYQGPLRG